MLTIAHRGASALYPENTLRAFIAAVDLGADMCEFDVRKTRDGEVVVIHDATVNRTTNGRGRVSAMNVEAIKQLDAGVRFGEEFRDEPLPTLAEVAAALGGNCGRRCQMDVELKERGLESRVCNILRERDVIESAIISSFDWDQLKIVAEKEPDLRLALLGQKAPKELLQAAVAMKAFAIAPRFDVTDDALCIEAHRLGLAVYVWTVDDASTMRRLSAAGVDGIMTNDPKRLRQVMAD